MGIYVLSARQLISSVSLDPIFELEDILVQSCDATLLVPTAQMVTKQVHLYPEWANQFAKKVIRRTVGLYQPIDDLDLPDESNVLLIVVTHPGWLEMLSCIPRWRQRFDLVVAYVFDAWFLEWYPQYTRWLDHLFVPMPEIIKSLKQYLGIPVSLLPFASDVLLHGSNNLDRAIDLVSYGRIPAAHNTAFAQTFNHPHSHQLYYRSTPRATTYFPDKPYAERREIEDTAQLYQILRKTKIALAYDTMYPGMRLFPHPFVTLRWFQCGATGCAIAGKRPTTPLADELLNWEDATIELPDQPVACVGMLKDLLQDTTRLNTIHRRNYLENLARHDWRHRIKAVMGTLQIPVPPPLGEALSALQAKLATISQS
jgi:hypothetical protein